MAQQVPRLPILSQRVVSKDHDPSQVLQQALVIAMAAMEPTPLSPLRTVAQRPRQSYGNIRNITDEIQGIDDDLYFGRAHNVNGFRKVAVTDDDNGDERLRRKHKDVCDRLSNLEEDFQRLKLILENEQNENERMRDEIARKTREISALTLHVETLNQHLETARTNDSQSFLHSRKDNVVEMEALKSKLSRAERDRDAMMFQIQEIERRTKMERDEETAFREELAARSTENERRATYAELQRSRAEAEAGAARQQVEHWRTAARNAQDEVAALRGQVEALREIAYRNGAISKSAIIGIIPEQHQNANQLPQQQAILEDSGVANTLLRRQQLAAASNQQHTIETPQKADVRTPKPDMEFVGKTKQRLVEIAQEIQRLDDAMENLGPASGRTLQQRLQREQLRRQMDGLSREAAALRATLPDS